MATNLSKLKESEPFTTISAEAPLSILAQSLSSTQFASGAMFIFRGRIASRIKILWWDGQGFCIFYKCLNNGRFIWSTCPDNAAISLTHGQFSALLGGADWREPACSDPPKYTG